MQHSLAVAVAARKLAEFSRGLASDDGVFAAGLFHDIGLAIESQAFPEEFTKLVDRFAAGSVEFLPCERELIGADHQILGVGLTTKWNFPLHYRVAAGFHHNPEMLTPDLRPFAMVLRAADILCCQEGLGLCDIAGDREIPGALLDALSISRIQIEEVRKSLATDVAQLESIWLISRFGTVTRRTVNALTTCQ